jgi:hypothetical protein
MCPVGQFAARCGAKELCAPWEEIADGRRHGGAVAMGHQVYVLRHLFHFSYSFLSTFSLLQYPVKDQALDEK